MSLQPLGMAAKRNDMILLAGKGHEEYEITKTKRLPFCEKEIVRAAFERRGRRNETTDPTESDK